MLLTSVVILSLMLNDTVSLRFSCSLAVSLAVALWLSLSLSPTLDLREDSLDDLGVFGLLLVIGGLLTDSIMLGSLLLMDLAMSLIALLCAVLPIGLGYAIGTAPSPTLVLSDVYECGLLCSGDLSEPDSLLELRYVKLSAWVEAIVLTWLLEPGLGPVSVLGLMALLVSLDDRTALK